MQPAVTAGRPRIHPVPTDEEKMVQTSLRLRSGVFRRLMEHLHLREARTSQREFVERAIVRELDDPQPTKGDHDGDGRGS